MMTKTYATVCKDLQDDAIDNRNFLPEVITRDESLVYVYAPETKDPYLCVCTRNKAAFIPVEEAIISTFENGRAG
jgi:hypothetical protein